MPRWSHASAAKSRNWKLRLQLPGGSAAGLWVRGLRQRNQARNAQVRQRDASWASRKRQLVLQSKAFNKTGQARTADYRLPNEDLTRQKSAGKGSGRPGLQRPCFAQALGVNPRWRALQGARRGLPGLLAPLPRAGLRQNLARRLRRSRLISP